MNSKRNERNKRILNGDFKETRNILLHRGVAFDYKNTRFLPSSMLNSSAVKKAYYVQKRLETEWNVRAIKNEENLRNVDGGWIF